MSKEINRNIADALAAKENADADKKVKRKKVSKAKAKAGRIKADKRNKK
jgi:hypothetical protein